MGRRETKEPRKAGMAQKVQRRSQPEAIFSEAQGADPSRARTTGGPEAGATSARLGRSVSSSGAAAGATPVPGTAVPARAAWRSTGLSGSRVRRSRGTCEAGRSPASTACRWVLMSA